MSSEEAGISLMNVQNCGIINNNVSWNYWSRGIYLFNSGWNNITSNIVSNNYFGIFLFDSNDNILIDNTLFSNVGHGIYLYSSNGNRIFGNNASFNYDYGILLSYSYQNNVTENKANFNGIDGIRLSHSIGNDILDNNASYNQKVGIYSWECGRNIITYNRICMNEEAGIYLYYSNMSIVTDNIMIENGIIIWGASIEFWNTHEIDISNNVNGKPLHYWKNQTGGSVPPNAGQVILANCTNVKIESQELFYSTTGIQLGFSSNNVVEDNKISNNKQGIDIFNSNENNITGNIVNLIDREGIRLWTSNKNNIIKNKASNNKLGIYIHYSDDNNLTGNNVSHNSNGITIYNSIGNKIVDNNIFSNIDGLYLGSSSNNCIYHNNIMGNTYQAYDDMNDNFWNDTYPSGGNYWSDYYGIDLNSTPTQNVPPPDGIGDTPYFIDPDSKDNYPLMSPIGNCIFLREGWNLISLPFIQPDTNLDVVLSSIIGSYDAVQWYNASDNSDYWKHNSIKKSPNLNDLSNIDHIMGFWIHITKPGGVLFEYFGIEPTSNQTIQLYPGWNLVGFPSLTSYNRTEGLNNLTFGTHVDSIWTYDAATQKWKKIEQSDYFEIGQGYWIHAKTKCEWEVPL